MKILILTSTLLLLTACSGADIHTSNYYENEVDGYNGIREAELEEVIDGYGYGTDESGEAVEVYIEEWYNSESGYGQDEHGNEIEFNYYN